MKWALSLAVAAGVTLSTSAFAQAPATNDLNDLVPYDLDGSRTLKALQGMSQEAQSLASGKRKEELAFVRAVALSDLWVIARATQREGLEKQVAESLGVEPAQTARELEAALVAVDHDVVRDIVRDAREAVRMAEGSAPVDAGARGPRSESLFLSRITGAVSRNADPRANINQLERFGSDPCEQANAPSCGELYRDFDLAGRKAIHALVRAAKAPAVFQRESKDPFVIAMEPVLTAQTRALSSITLQPNARLSQAMTRLQAVESGSAEAPDLLVLVSHGRIEYAFMPRVRINDVGAVVIEKSDAPSFPSMASVKFEDNFAPFVRPIDVVVQALRSLHERFPSARVAVGGAPDLKAHVLARTFLSAQSAGFEKLSMLAATPAGEMRNVNVEIIGALRAADVGPRDLSVVVRLGGFTVKQAGPSVTIPRVRNEGGFEFDYEGLRSNAQPRKAKSTKLTFMSDVTAKTLSETAFMVAPQNHTLTVVLP